MNSAERKFMAKVTTLNSQPMPKLHLVICWLITVLILAAGLTLWFTPWVQTAQGAGKVNSLDPLDRTQAISALLDGQIKTWHVREGMLVRQGDPIVTLIDVDSERLEKLESQLSAARQLREANEVALQNAENNLNRQMALQQEGLVSRKQVEDAQIKVQELKAKVASAVSDINEVSMSLSRQSTQTKVAPVDGTVVRLFSSGMSTFVKAGTELAQFIPSGVQRHVQVTISGLDAPLVKPGAKARLQFEGWPVFQFSGWPGSSIGTFGAEVVYVEPVAAASGAFTVWLKPDSEDIPWPAESVARLGSRVKAWILLEEVRLGYELWRQLNNFPPKSTAALSLTDESSTLASVEQK